MTWKMSLATSAGPTVFGPMLYAGRVTEAIKHAAELGYDGVEISLKKVQELEWPEIKGMLAANNLQLSALGSGRAFLEDKLSFSDSDPRIRQLAVDRIKEHVDVAAEFGAPVIVGLIRGAKPSSGDGKREIEWIAECTQQCADHAASRGNSILIEAINRYETVFQNNAAQMLDLLASIDRKNVGILLDVFHMNIEEVSIGDAIRKAGPSLRHFHIVDSNRWAPGWGHVQYDDIIAALREINYQGWFSAEILPLPDDTAAARQARAFVRGIDS